MFAKKRLSMAVTVAMGLGSVVAGGPAAHAQEPRLVEEVVVTGSRIARRDFTSNSPVVTVDAEQFELTNTVNTENLLNQLPQTVAGFNSTSNGGGDGTATVNLRGLGAQRTLVLMDGIRVTPSSDQGIADLNTIPPAMIERVEVVTGGASAVYGSDAIAGVVNFIMKKDFEGIDISVAQQMSGENDGGTTNFNLTMGGNFADGRGNAVVSLGYNERESLLSSEREYSRFALAQDRANDRVVPGGSTARQGTQIQVGSIKFDPDGNVSPFVQPDDLYNFAPTNYLQIPQERFQLSSFARFEINEKLEVYARGTFTNYQADRQLAPLPFGFSGPTTFTVDGNPFLTAAAQQELSERYGEGQPDVNGNGLADQVNVLLFGRVTTPREFISNRNVAQFVFGARGDITDNWSYDVYFSEGRFENAETVIGQLSNPSLFQALLLDTSDPDNVTCQDTSLDCVPANIYGEGNLTPEMEDFFLVDVNANTDVTQRVFAANINGDSGSFELPGGKIGFAGGYEFIYNSSDFRPSENLGNPNLNQQAFPPVNGKFHSKSLFAEFYAPILSGAPFAEILALEGAYRTSDYTTVGTVDAYKIAVEWAPIADIRFRTSFNTAVRAPNIDELFGPQSFAAQGAVDPCSAVAFEEGIADVAGRRALCIATGVPDNLVFSPDINLPADQVRALTGGNPDLAEEEADTFTAGFVLTPAMLPGLTVSVDYFSIEMAQRIGIFGGGGENILSTCYGDPNIGGLGSPFCNAVVRFPGGPVELTLANNQNAAESNLEGVDLAVQYSWDNSLGFWTVNYASTFSMENSFVAFTGANEVDCAGRFGNTCNPLIGTADPEYRHRATLRWNNNANLTAQLVWQHIGELDNTDTTAVTEFRTIDAYDYLDGSVSYKFMENYRATFGVNNIADKEPPRAGANAVFDQIGRMFFLNVGASF
ncbi:TonB-dependent receptor plug domain-containing protein [Chromatocurvus halotolerans]|uniref:TonB-dependent receptor-like protein n=1 Tax=Chromatocurvus halotolerans TaxID=1132028 RepID=A0A4R2KWB4_9GAMM|nr:TonB-dependent receptor [Chromatocurvus halotolerans]TCO75539.1 TonB-dependent receptor-like protein [Chromatocurvus halotolerans]